MTEPKTAPTINAENIPTIEEFKADWKPKVRLALAAMGEKCGVRPADIGRMMNEFWKAFDNITDEQLDTLYNYAYGDGLPPLETIKIARIH